MEDQVEFTAYTCSSCSIISTAKYVITRHHRRSQRCRGATVVEATGTFSFPRNPQELENASCGPKPWDHVAYFKNRAPAFHENGFDERTDYLLNSPHLLDILVIRPTANDIPSLPMKLYSYLWGKNAPPRFQSIVLKRNVACNDGIKRHTYVYLDEIDENGEPWMDTETKKHDVEKKVMEELFEFYRRLITNSLPDHRPDLVEHGTRIKSLLLEYKEHGITYLDYLTQSDGYKAFQKSGLQATTLIERAKLMKRNVVDAMKKIRIDTSGINTTFRAYKCSCCSYVTTEASRMARHFKQSSRCTDATPFEAEGSFAFPKVPDTSHRRIAPGPKPWDASSHFQGHIPAFEDDALDQRIDYLFETPELLDKLLAPRPRPETILLLRDIYIALWGSKAPPHFQSIVARSTTYVYLESVSDLGEYHIATAPNKTEFEKKVIEELFAFLKTVCRDSIPTRRPELQDRADSICFSLLEYRHMGLSYIDYITKNDLYTKRKNDLKGGMQFKRDAERIKRIVSYAMHGIKARS